MPAVTFRHSIAHISQNWGVRIAALADTLCVLIMLAVVPAVLGAGAQPVGRQPGCGVRIIKTPNIMNKKYAMPMTTNVAAIGW